MAAEKRPFLHIAVSDGEEDDLVIQAGSVPATDFSSAEADEAGGDVGSRAAFGGAYERADAEGVVADGDAGLDDERSAETEGTPSLQEGKTSDENENASVQGVRAERERDATSLQDLESSKMGGLQKAIVAVAVLAVIGFAVYYIFFR